ncbi:dihydroneopterin aldolase [Fodinicola acaciae]|uniref:dihydroneopterin aldolase n=1 Tax=Fodinicola acaciae TaxID=2681555 RepID=UPI0013D4CF96|nr:dihydroneopterin aldolase [Fodinicola acaciae]
MPDRITLRGLTVHGFHGDLDHERVVGQVFVVDATIELDLSAAGSSDQLSDTVDYGKLTDQLAEIVAGEPVHLLETLAERLAAACLAYQPVLAAEITVHKPHAPIAHPFADLTVTIRRERG